MKPNFLFERLLGSRFSQMPEPVRAMHRVADHLSATGRCAVHAPSTPLAWLVARAFGFPPPGRDLPLRVEMQRNGGGETWTRRMGAHRFSSRLGAGTGLDAGQLSERVGPLEFYFDLATDPRGLRWELRRVALGPLTLPRGLWPAVYARESSALGRYRFQMSVQLPRVGRIIGYSGWLVPDAALDVASATGDDRV